DLRHPVGGDFVSEELWERAHAAVDLLGQGAGERRAAVFEREVDVDGVASEEEIAHRTADEVRAALLLMSDFSHELEGTALRAGKVCEVGHYRGRDSRTTPPALSHADGGGTWKSSAARPPAAHRKSLV